MTFKYFLCLLGVILLVPLLALIVRAFMLPITSSGLGYLLASSLAIAGLILALWKPKYYSWLIVAGVFTFLLIAGGRIISAELNATRKISMLTLPQEKGTRWLSYVIDEQDGIIFGEALFHQIGGSSAIEHTNISQALSKDYSDLSQIQAIVPSPIVSTYLNFQNTSAYDLIVIAPEVKSHPETGVIFLHGFMGNVSAQCWEIAQAVNRFGALTVCPSTGWQGEWWQPDGEAILRTTFAYLRKQGIQKIYLGGFSNGGFGISRLVSKLGDEAGLSGLIFIDGISDGAGIRKMGLPVLVVQGTLDERMPASEARRAAEIIGKLATYVELNSDHFLIMKKPDQVQDAIVTWLEDHSHK
jgi:pimeloyl-ACP methyl ester carboxylesterase